MFERLQLTSPETCAGTLIMTPNTEAMIKTNRDGTARLQYQIAVPPDQEDSVHQLLKVTDQGQLISGSKIGQASLLITAHEDFAVNQSLIVLVKVHSYWLSSFRIGYCDMPGSPCLSKTGPVYGPFLFLNFWVVLLGPHVNGPKDH